MKKLLILLMAFALVHCTADNVVEDDKPLSISGCVEGGNNILGTERSDKLNSKFNTLFPEARKEAGFGYWAADQECDLKNNTTLVTFTYVTDAKLPIGPSTEEFHTVFAQLNKKDELISYADVICPFGDDLGSARMTDTFEMKMLVDCSKGGRGQSGYWWNAEYHVIDFENFSEKIVWREMVQDPHGRQKLITKIDETQGLPTQWRSHFE